MRPVTKYFVGGIAVAAAIAPSPAGASGRVVRRPRRPRTGRRRKDWSIST